MYLLELTAHRRRDSIDRSVKGIKLRAVATAKDTIAGITAQTLDSKGVCTSIT
jgi:hypothetical protein